MSKQKESWLKRVWKWFVECLHAVEDEEPVKAPPSPLPPKKTELYPQGQLYQALNSKPNLLAGNRPSPGQRGVRVYDYCGVIFPKADIVYHYLNPDPTIRVGDHVLVPVHVHGVTKEADGIVVSTGQYLAQCVPYPVGETSWILRKLP